MASLVTLLFLCNIFMHIDSVTSSQMSVQVDSTGPLGFNSVPRRLMRSRALKRVMTASSERDGRKLMRTKRHQTKEAVCGGNDSSESLPRYTPEQSDWSPTCDNVDDHTPPPSVAWDGTTIYNPVTSLDLATPRDESVFYNQMCPKNSDGKNMLRGLRQLFDELQPFADNTNPTKAEVDRWNGLVLTHIRNLVGIDHEAKPDICLMARALWANQWRHTKIWSPTDAANPNRYVCPPEGSDGHCGASFVPKTIEKQRPYLPPGHGKCSATAGSEGAFGHSPGTPWSLKTAGIFCGTLKAEGYWGGHTGPFWGREKFGFGFWHDGSARFKWGGVSKPSIYKDPRADMFTKLDGLAAACQSQVCENLFWPGEAFDTAQQCRDYILDNPNCSNDFFTYNQGNRGCGCYPPEKTQCGKVQSQSSRNTFFLTPVDSGSRNTGPAPPGGPYHATTATGEVKSIKMPKWKGLQCGDKIKWLGGCCDRQMCLEMIFANPECDDKYMLVVGGKSVGCYPPDQAEISDRKTDCISSAGREFYEIVDGCSGIAGESAQLDACGMCNGTNACFDGSGGGTSPPNGGGDGPQPTLDPTPNPTPQPTLDPTPQPTPNPTTPDPTPTDEACGAPSDFSGPDYPGIPTGWTVVEGFSSNVGDRKSCGNGWNAYKGGIGIGAIQTALHGSGMATIQYGDCWSQGTAVLYKNGVQIDSTTSESKSYTFSFVHGDEIKLRDEGSNAVLWLGSLTFQCQAPTTEAPTTAGIIELSGGNDGSATNLQRCTGECDNDAQCAAGLKCFQRQNGETIPGCSGPGGGPTWDYCYDPNQA